MNTSEKILASQANHRSEWRENLAYFLNRRNFINHGRWSSGERDLHGFWKALYRVGHVILLQKLQMLGIYGDLLNGSYATSAVTLKLPL